MEPVVSTSMNVSHTEMNPNQDTIATVMLDVWILREVLLVNVWVDFREMELLVEVCPLLSVFGCV